MIAVFDPPTHSFADLLRKLGDVPRERVRQNPPPGTATFSDLSKPENAGCELVDGTLVEKAVGYEANMFGAWLLVLVYSYARSKKLGFCTGEQGMIELPDGPEGPVRAPDVAFVAWDSLENRCPPKGSCPRLAPDLVVEVLSPSNTKAEMERKRGEYFRAGVRLYWEFDPLTDFARVYTAVDRYRDLNPDDTLDGGDVLPGFSMVMKDLWAKHRATGNS